MIRNLSSLCETKIIYDKEKINLEFNIDWIIEGVKFVKNKKMIFEIIKNLQFRLFVPLQNIHSQNYIDNVISFHEKTANAANLLKNFKTRNFQTIQTSSRILSKSFGQIYWEKKIGENVFFIVTQVFNVSTEEEYAQKKSINKSKYKLRDWKKEAFIMSSIKHVSTHLVQHIILLDRVLFKADKNQNI